MSTLTRSMVDQFNPLDVGQYIGWTVTTEAGRTYRIDESGGLFEDDEGRGLLIILAALPPREALQLLKLLEQNRLSLIELVDVLRNIGCAPRAGLSLLLVCETMNRGRTYVYRWATTPIGSLAKCEEGHSLPCA